MMTGDGFKNHGRLGGDNPGPQKAWRRACLAWRRACLHILVVPRRGNCKPSPRNQPPLSMNMKEKETPNKEQRRHWKEAMTLCISDSIHYAHPLVVEHLGKVLIPSFLEPCDGLFLADPLPLSHLKRPSISIKKCPVLGNHGLGRVLEKSIIRKWLRDALRPLALLTRPAGKFCRTHFVGLDLALGNTIAGTLHDHVEIHTVNASIGIVLDSEIDVLIDTEAPVACFWET